MLPVFLVDAIFFIAPYLNAKFLQEVEKFMGAFVTLLLLESGLCENTFCLLVLEIIKIIKRNGEVFVYHVRDN